MKTMKMATCPLVVAVASFCSIIIGVEGARGGRETESHQDARRRLVCDRLGKRKLQGKGKGGKGGSIKDSKKGGRSSKKGKGKGGKGKGYGGGTSVGTGGLSEDGDGYTDTDEPVEPGYESADDLVKVNISIQPAYWAIPIYAAQEMGWFNELGLDVTISVYPSGGPQVAAAVNEEAWDFGMAGSVPNVIAGSQGITTIGISNDESAATELYGAPGVMEYPPSELTPGMFASTPSSTGDLLMRICLEQAGISFTDENLFGGSQGDIITALENGDSTYGALWPPNTYSYSAANPETEAFCSGADVSFPILGGLMVRESWGSQNPDIVGKILAAYLRGVTLMLNKAALDLTLELSSGFYDYVGVSISEMDMMRDLKLRPIFNLDDQLNIMDRNFVNGDFSQVDDYYTTLGEFLVEQGVISEPISPSDYVTDSYMKHVSEDCFLREYAFLGSIDTGCS